eukprot:TRINITY_DN13362_c0_g1_i1.p1 TRINITY_DN13362_c0_g1~~TRINITY_DN13362_c0_g1_i1.p1  ORF type:complete len:531 (+),score=83.32 TRINITY_DN13362_c0_g1_i1:331-1923(+)
MANPLYRGVRLVAHAFESLSLLILNSIIRIIGNVVGGGAANGELDPNARIYRFFILVLVCGVATGSYYAYDSLGPIEQELSEGLNLSPYDFTMLYSMYSLPNVIVPAFGGVFIDRVGTRVGLNVLLLIVLMGSVLTAISPFFHSFHLALAGRFFFGMGAESSYVAQTAIFSEWFRGKELATAMGLSTTLSHMGTVLAFNLSYTISRICGTYTYSLWVASLVCLLSLVSGLLYVVLDRQAERMRKSGFAQLPEDDTEGDEEKKKENGDSGSTDMVVRDGEIRKSEEMERGMSSDPTGNDGGTGDVDKYYPRIEGRPGLTDRPGGTTGVRGFFVKLSKQLKSFPTQYWIACCLAFSFYGSIFPFTSISSHFFVTKFGYHEQYAGGVSSIVMMTAMLFSPIVGRVVDRRGNHTTLVVCGAAILPFAYWLLGATNVNPVFPMMMIGAGFCIVPAALYPAISNMVPEDMQGLAFGLDGSFQNVALMLINGVVGNIKNETGEYWHYWVCLYLSAQSTVALMLAFIWYMSPPRQASG